MRRRDLLALLGGAAAVLPVAPHAQQRQRTVALLGALLPGRAAASISLGQREDFERSLREEGYVDGRNIVIEYRYAADSTEFDKAANEIVGLGVDMIFAVGTAGALAAKRASSSIPIVAATMADPVADGLVASLSRPGANLTGNTFLGPELGPKRLQLLRELVPGITRIGALQHPGVYSERTMQNMLVEMQEGAKQIGVEFQVFDAAGPNDLDVAFEAMVEARQGALVVFPSQMFYVNYRRLVDLAASHRLPTMYAFKEAVHAGGLICYGADIPDLNRRAVNYVVRILKGEKPADLPVMQPTKFELVINMKTAKALGLTVPQSLLARADEVIE